MTTQTAEIQFRHGTAAAWTVANPVLLPGEPGYETDTGREKRGDGVTPYSSLPYIYPSVVRLDSYYDSPAYASKTLAIQAAYAAATTTRAVLECQANRVYQLDTGPLQVNPSTPLTVEGHGATLRAGAYAASPQVINFARTADGDTFQNQDFRDVIFDAAGVTHAGGGLVVGPSSSQRINFQHIYFRRCQWINVPVGAAGSPYYCLALDSLHVGAGEAQTSLVDIRLEQCRMQGGNLGAVVTGGTTGAGGIAVNVYHDQIYLDVTHDLGVTPTGSAGAAHVQIGSLGWGDYCEVRCIGANSGDVGVEIDGMQEAHIWGRVTDSWNAEYFARNFHAPRDLASQRYVYHGCEARVVNLTTSNAGSISAGFQVTATPTPDPGFGEMVLEDCSFLNLSATPENNGMALYHPAATAGAQRITIVGTFNVSFPLVNDAPGATRTPQPVFLAPSTSSGFTLRGGRIRVLYAGTGGANYFPRCVTLTPQTGCTFTVDLDGIVLASSLAGVAVGSMRGLILGLSGAAGGSLRGRIKYLGWESFSGADTTPALTNLAASSIVTIDGRFVFDEIDLRRDPAAAPAILAGGFDATNKAKYAVRSAVTPTYPIASVAMGSGNFAAATFTTATGNQYLGFLPAEIHFANGSGAGITAIDASKDGATYENVWTQASGAMTQSVIVPVENGDFIKATFATTQPTTRVRFRRAQ